MALPSSGQIDLYSIASEFGKATNMGALYGVAPGVPTSGQISFANFYGKSSGLASATITVGSQYDYMSGIASVGYSQSFGSISPTVFSITNSNFLALYRFGSPSSSTGTVVLIVQGNKSNSGWSTMNIDSVSFSRTSATFTANSSQSRWSWTGASTSTFTNNPTSVTWN